MAQRFTIKSNGVGGYDVRDKRSGADVGSTCSHRSNAQIKADRLNGERDTSTPLAEWFRFYGAKG
jgi:hypothetical protein